MSGCKAFIVNITLFSCFIPLAYSSSHTSTDQEDPVVVDSLSKNMLIGFHVSYLQPEKELSFEQVIQSKNFIKSQMEVPNSGASRHSYWVKFTIRNKGNMDHLLLNVAHPTLDEVELFYPDSTSVFLGGDKPFYDRKYKNPNYIFDLATPLNNSETYYLRVRSTEYVMLPMFITKTNILWDTLGQEKMFLGIYLGAMLVMFLYNLFIYLNIRFHA